MSVLTVVSAALGWYLGKKLLSPLAIRNRLLLEVGRHTNIRHQIATLISILHARHIYSLVYYSNSSFPTF